MLRDQSPAASDAGTRALPVERSPTPQLRRLIIAALLIAGLWFGRAVLIPIALAMLITLILTPLVGIARRLGLPRALAVLVITTLSFTALGLLGWGTWHELGSIGRELPRWEDNIRKRIEDLRSAGKGGVLERLTALAERLSDETSGRQPGQKAPEEVVVKGDSPILSRLPTTVEFVVTQLVTAGLVIALVLFLLTSRDDLRNRLLRLVGFGRLPATTRLLDEAISRISHYLLAQFALNAAFGLLVGVGLWLMGLPYVLLWGALAAVLRLIPYVGSVVAAALPALMSLAAMEGWLWPLFILAYVLALDAVCAFVIEPLFYGNTAGVMPVALLVAIAFWTTVWGPIGFLLATPLTVCVLVIAKYVPEMGFLLVLMSDELGTDVPAVFYQRLLARDEDEASHLARTYLASHPAEQIFDELLVPALARAKHNSLAGALTTDDRRTIHRLVRDLVEDLDPLPAPPPARELARDLAAWPVDVPRVVVCGCPASDEADELLLVMLRQLSARDAEVEVLSTDLLMSEMVARATERAPRLLCVANLAPGGAMHARQLCKRLRAAGPETRIMILRAPSGISEAEPRDAWLSSTGADEVVSTLLAARDFIVQLRGLRPVSAASG
ncbi:MAG: AI-2E family transporter [Planctomycetota bacterium]